MICSNGISPKYAIFTTCREFAVKILEQCITQHNGIPSQVRLGQNEAVAYMQDGTIYKWIRPYDNARGYKCSAAIVDLATCGYDFCNELVRAICLFAEDADFKFVDSEHQNDESYDLDSLIDRLKKIQVILYNPKICFKDYEECINPVTGINVEDNNLIFSFNGIG